MSDRNTIPAIPDWLGPGKICSNEISRDDIIIRTGPENLDSVQSISRNQISFELVVHTVSIGADQIPRRSAADVDSVARCRTVPTILRRVAACSIRSDVIRLNDVVGAESQ